MHQSNINIPMNIQDRFPLGLTGWISLQCRRFSRVFSNTTVQKHQFFSAQPSLWSKSCILYMTIGKTIALTIQTFVGKCLWFLICSLGCQAFLLSSKRLLISWLGRKTKAEDNGRGRALKEVGRGKEWSSWVGGM